MILGNSCSVTGGHIGPYCPMVVLTHKVMSGVLLWAIGVSTDQGQCYPR